MLTSLRTVEARAHRLLAIERTSWIVAPTTNDHVHGIVYTDGMDDESNSQDAWSWVLVIPRIIFGVQRPILGFWNVLCLLKKTSKRAGPRSSMLMAHLHDPEVSSSQPDWVRLAHRQ